MQASRGLFSMSNGMNIVHGALSILLFVASIIVFTSKVIHFNGFTILLLSFWMVFTLLHGGKFYDQYYFMYTYGGRGVFYFFVGLLVWGSNESNFFSGVVSLLFMLFGIAGIGLGLFSNYEAPRPIIGPIDFSPYGQKSVALASQADFMDDSPSSSHQNTNNPAFTI
ncbi:hypothetical protein CYY_002613 [Polysphondylium violaceum]|uniref:Transmembrane protein n=1 Tax=Polysphondylium violaceum TaxID=133409 RepID=A0A8J4PZW2_9MYCE|nr:hypothetical protein CYY_002613 [Polysphondylium violaceum]